VSGYASELLMVPELKFGIVVLTNEMEHAAPICVPIANILIPAFDALLASLQTSQLPPNWEDYTGIYSYGGINLTVYKNDDSQLAVSSPDYLGPDLPFIMISENIFQFIPPKDDPEDCMDQQTNEVIYQLIEFQEDGSGNIVSCTMPGIAWSYVFTKFVTAR